MLYAKVERETGKILKYREYDVPARVFHKPTVWLLVQKDAIPPYDPKTQRIERTENVPNVAGGVLGDEEVTLGFNIVPLTQTELDERLTIKVENAYSSLGPLLQAINDGSFAPGQNLTPAAMKDILRNYL